jgi:hypothetical protein
MQTLHNKETKTCVNENEENLCFLIEGGEIA